MRFFMVLLFFFLAPQAAYAACTSPNGVAGTLDYFGAPDNVFKYCNGTSWISMGGAGDPCILPEPWTGAVCADGSIYVGKSPDGNVKMFTTAGIPSSAGWGSHGVFRNITNSTTGESNTAALVAFGAGAHPAAEICSDLVAHSHDDWYLPASAELGVIQTRGNSILWGLPSVNHWSSTENNANTAYMGTSGTGSKFNGFYARCVRRE